MGILAVGWLQGSHIAKVPYSLAKGGPCPHDPSTMPIVSPNNIGRKGETPAVYRPKTVRLNPQLASIYIGKRDFSAHSLAINRSK